jgi:uncharacterized protein GlcG (DUF336 family)
MLTFKPPIDNSRHLQKFIFFTALLCIIFITSSKAQTQAATVLDLKTARALADKVFECGNKKGWHLTVAIVNAEGNLILLNHGDGAYPGSVEASMQKARSANAFRRPTSEFVAALAQGRTGILSIKDVVPLEGGIPLSMNGVALGGIGVSGARSIEDEECANYAAMIITSTVTN